MYSFSRIAVFQAPHTHPYKMPFREKLKKAFKSNNSSQPSSKNPSPTLDQKKEPTRWPSNVYRPDEPMPRPKYRAPVKKEHKDKLEAFDFGNSWRRKSHVSLYSPMGSRMPSRRGSRVGNRESMELRRKSIAQQSGKTGTTSRSNSITSSTYDPAKARTVQRAAQPSTLNPEPEQYGDDDVANGTLTSTVAFFVPPRKAQVIHPPTPPVLPIAREHISAHLHTAQFPPYQEPSH